MRINRIKLITEMARQEIGVAELAERARVSRVTITAIRGGKACTNDTAIHIAGALGVPVQELIEEG